ncbi:MAG: glycosyltransferase family 4 protein [Clostridia bacterium]|nr:glycosyltransferase family 4 protein [Clostridia bacterium]
MRILYGFSNCTDRLYRKLTEETKKGLSVQCQKYHGLLIRGLVKNGAQVTCYSGLPINRSITKKLWIHEPDEQENGARYHYYTTLNVPVLRQLMVFFGAWVHSLFASKSEPVYAICDCLNVANAYGMAIGCRMRKIPLVLIVTDLPDMMPFSGWQKKLANRLFARADGFLFLTEAMNERLNKGGKPYLVMEGHVDDEAPVRSEEASYERTVGKKVIVYAGSLMKIYGIGNLTEGFLKANVPDSELWIYGNGDYRAELEATARDQKRIRYFGVSDNARVVAEEQKAALLVNPRPSGEEYTKYSFPSKNMEYMVSGTPVLTTKLPGMPKAYEPFVFLIEREDADGIASALRAVFAHSEAERTKRGAMARAFVLEQKTNVAQAARLMAFLETAFWQKGENQ